VSFTAVTAAGERKTNQINLPNLIAVNATTPRMID
jgi:hypothetical protein